jgi:Cof subfamily protein (haloacid dehalogenase superfamily)
MKKVGFTMKPITLVATDLDGTLLNSRKNVTPRTKIAIKELKKHGILFGIASGRPVESGEILCQDWGLENDISFLIGMNGGVIYDLRTKEKDAFHLMDGKLVKEIIHHFDDMPDLIFQIMVGNDRYTSRSTPETQEHAKLFGENEIETDLDKFLEDRKVNKLIIYSDPARQPAVRERALEFEDNSRFVHCATANNLYEYMDPAINKGFGIEKIAEHYGVNIDNVLVFGDANNDIPMLEKAGTSVVMKNGTPEAKAAGTIVSDYTNDEDALAHFIIEEIIPNSQGYLLLSPTHKFK